MKQHFIYCTDLQGTQFNEGNLQWVHALSLGKHQHPTYGTLEFTQERIRRFVNSVKSKIRGIDPDIDYDHKLDPSKGHSAAGWVKDAEERSDGLWVLVEWTNKARQAIQDREYRYFSAEFADEWIDAKGNKHEDVILGGGLTNRPFLKDLVPVNLSELSGEENNNQEGKMDRAELARILGLSDDATEDDIKTKLNELSTKNGSAELDLSKLSVSINEEGKVVVSDPSDKDKTAAFSVELPKQEKQEENDEEKELAKLAESNPAVAKILSEQAAMKEEFKQIKATARLSEVSAQLSELGQDNKAALPPVAQDKLRNLMVRLPKGLSDELADSLKELLKVGIVDLSERSARKGDGKQEQNSDVIVKFFAEVDKVKAEAKEKENKVLSTKEASDIVAARQPRLFADYTDAVDEGQRLTEQEA